MGPFACRGGACVQFGPLISASSIWAARFSVIFVHELFGSIYNGIMLQRRLQRMRFSTLFRLCHLRTLASDPRLAEPFSSSAHGATFMVEIDFGLASAGPKK